MLLRLGLRQIDGLHRDAADRLAARRPYRTVEELRSRGRVPVHAIQRLAAADAFRSMGLDRRAALWDSRALKPAPDLPLFAYAEARDEGTGSEPAQLPAMPLSEHVVNDYQTIRLQPEGAPDALPARALCGAEVHHRRPLKTIRDGKRLSIAGLVLIRQRPGSAKGVVFITLEDETGVANLVIWPDVFGKQRKIVMGARLMAVHGIVQRDPDSDVIHVVARRLEDHSHMLRHLSDDLLPATAETRRWRGSCARRRPPPARRRNHPQKPRFPLNGPLGVRGADPCAIAFIFAMLAVQTATPAPSLDPGPLAKPRRQQHYRHRPVRRRSLRNGRLGERQAKKDASKATAQLVGTPLLTALRGTKAAGKANCSSPTRTCAQARRSSWRRRGSSRFPAASPARRCARPSYGPAQTAVACFRLAAAVHRQAS